MNFVHLPLSAPRVSSLLSRILELPAAVWSLPKVWCAHPTLRRAQGGDGRSIVRQSWSDVLPYHACVSFRPRLQPSAKPRKKPNRVVKICKYRDVVRKN